MSSPDQVPCHLADPNWINRLGRTAGDRSETVVHISERSPGLPFGFSYAAILQSARQARPAGPARPGWQRSSVGWPAVVSVTSLNVSSPAMLQHAVLRALDAFEENVILIMGGKETNLNYAPLRDKIQRKVKTLILVGEAKERINRDIGDYSETFLIGTFEEAVLIAYQKSRIGDTVLLSPGASSFDMFDSYVERGNYFKEIVNKFK